MSEFTGDTLTLESLQMTSYSCWLLTAISYCSASMSTSLSISFPSFFSLLRNLFFPMVLAVLSLNKDGVFFSFMKLNFLGFFGDVEGRSYYSMEVSCLRLSPDWFCLFFLGDQYFCRIIRGLSRSYLMIYYWKKVFYSS